MYHPISKISILFLVAVAALAIACNRSGSDKDFEVFYERFLRDSLYQMEHITWPLEGIPDNVGSEEEAAGFRWERKDWIMHRPFDESTGFRSEFTPISEDLVIERIVHESGDYGMLRRYARLGDEGWQLIYYAGLNPLRE